MFILFILFIAIRPFICSPAFPELNFIYSVLLSTFLIAWIIIVGLPVWENKPIKFSLVLFLLALAASLIWSNNKLIGAFEISQYINGILLFLVCQSMSPDHRNKTILALITTAVFISFQSIHQFFFGFQNILDYLASANISDLIATHFISQRRVYSPFITPSALSSYLIMVLPLALTMKNRLWIVAPLLIALLLTKSIGAFLTLITISTIYFFWHKKVANQKFPFLIIILSAAALIIFILRSHAEYQTFQPGFSLKMRISYWLDTIQIIKDHPITGLGLGNFDLPTARYSHNLFLQIWAENGLLAITAFILLIISIIRSSLMTIRKSADKALTIGLMYSSWAFLIHNIIDFTFFLPETCFIWCVMLGLLLNKSAPATTTS